LLPACSHYLSNSLLQRDQWFRLRSAQTSEQMHRRVMDQFETLYAESAERPKIMAIAMHCYLSGVPHRIAYMRRAFEEVLSQPGVAAWDGLRILNWYKKQGA
jgi:allantoinase